MKKKYAAFMIGVCLCAAGVVTSPFCAYATVVDVTDDELEEGEQTTVVEPGAEDEEETDSTNSAENNGNTSGANSANQSSAPATSAKSSDSSLSKLGISPGTLTPAFSADVFQYTATVDESVTKVSIPATPNNSKAVIASVTGAKSLTMGSNTVKIVVEAENGSISTYTITVNRGSATTPAQDQTQESPAETAGNNDQQTEGMIEGVIDVDPSLTQTSEDAKVQFDSDGNLVYDGETYVTKDQIPEGNYVSLDKYNALYEQQQSEKAMYSKILIAMAVGLVFLIFILINLLFKIKDLKADVMLNIADEEEEKRPVAKNIDAEKKAIEKAEKKAEKKIAKEQVGKAVTSEADGVSKTQAKPKQKNKARGNHMPVAEEKKDDLEILDLNDM